MTNPRKPDKMMKSLIYALALILPLHGEEKQDIDFTALVAQADRYQLPKPPKNAALVLANTGWTSVLEQSSTDLDPSIYDPGFFLKTNVNGTPNVMTGFVTIDAEGQREHQPATLPFTTNPPEPKYGGYEFKGNSLKTFATAIQCARLGDLDNARALAQMYLRSEYNSGFQPLEASKPYKKNHPLLLASIA